MNNYALLIGIGQRPDDKHAIAVTATDATRLADELAKRCRYTSENIQSIVGEQAKKLNILRALDALIVKTKQNMADLVLVFYSGHALVENGQFYLVSRDADNAYLEDSALRGALFLNKINQIQSKAVLLLLNCCQAGAAAECIDVPFDKMAFIQQPNRAILTACSKSEQAFVSTPLSVFTYSLLSGLAGEGIKQEKKDKVTLFDLAMYVRENVVALSKGKQHPELAVLQQAMTCNFDIVDYSEGIPPFAKEARGGLYDSLGHSLDASMVLDADYRKQYEWLGNVKNVAINSVLKAKGDIKIGDTNVQDTQSSGQKANDKPAIKNAAIHSQLEAGGNIELGDKNTSDLPAIGGKNTVLNSTIQAGGNITLGDTVTNNTIILSEPPKQPLSVSNLKAQLLKWMGQGRIEAVFKRFEEIAQITPLDVADDLISLSARYSQLEQQNRRGTISHDNASRERNKINAALIQLITALEI